jgi:hypothetical protein
MCSHHPDESRDWRGLRDPFLRKLTLRKLTFPSWEKKENNRGEVGTGTELEIRGGELRCRVVLLS